MRRRFSASAAIRSLSFTRSSAASRISMPSSVYGPSAASIGSSSITKGMCLPEITPPFSAAPFTAKSPMTSPCELFSPSMWMEAPLSANTSRIAVRVGFRPTLWINKFESGNKEAAARKNTAEDKSPGTSSDFATSFPRPFPFPKPCTRIVWPSLSILAPNSSSAISVWSRVRAGSVTLVAPSANRPASSTADFTCALAMGIL